MLPSKAVAAQGAPTVVLATGSVRRPAAPSGEPDEQEGVRLLPAATSTAARPGSTQVSRAWWLPDWDGEAGGGGAEPTEELDGAQRGPAASAEPTPALVAAHGATGTARRALGGAVLAVAAVVVGIAVLGAVHGVDRVRSPAGRAAATADVAAPQPALVPTPPVQTPSAQTSSAQTSSAGASVPPAPSAPVHTPLTVFNNSRIDDLGTRMAARYRAAGWPVSEVGSLSGRFRASTVYYPAGQLQQAQELAQQFGIARVLPRLADLPGSGLAVVVTRDLA